MNHKKILLLCSLGALFEYYDFAIFALLMPIFKVQFFSGGNPTFDTIKAFAIFTSGYIARLLGGIWYSHQSDKYGRKKPFLKTLLLMAIPTIAIGFLPVYSQIGWIAPVLLLLFRISQGLAMGGESPSALTIIFESSPNHFKTTATGFLLGSIVFGSFLGSLLISGLTFFQSESSFHLWGWRIPFIFGGFLCIIGALLRRNLNETPEFLTMAKAQKNVSIPFLTLIQKYRFFIFKGIILGIPTAVAFMYYLLMPNLFLQPFYHVTIKNLIYLSSIGLVTNAFFDAFFGYLGDKWDPKKMYLIGVSLIGLWALVSHFIFLTHHVFYIYSAIYIMAILIGIPTASLFHMNLKMLPTEVRASGIAVILNMTNGIIVGNIPLFFSYLVTSSGFIIFPSIIIGILCFSAVLFVFFEQRPLPYLFQHS